VRGINQKPFLKLGLTPYFLNIKWGGPGSSLGFKEDKFYA